MPTATTTTATSPADPALPPPPLPPASRLLLRLPLPPANRRPRPRPPLPPRRRRAQHQQDRLYLPRHTITSLLEVVLVVSLPLIVLLKTERTFSFWNVAVPLLLRLAATMLLLGLPLVCVKFKPCCSILTDVVDNSLPASTFPVNSRPCSAETLIGSAEVR